MSQLESRSQSASSSSVADDIAADFFDDLASSLNDEPEEAASAEHIRDLEQRLSDRDRLVEILTERLERTADELDRIRRSGGATSTSADGGGECSTEVLHGQRELNEELTRFVGAWEERYEGPALRRIQNQLDDLQLLLEEKLTHPSSTSPQSLAAVAGSQYSIDDLSSSDCEISARLQRHSAEESSANAHGDHSLASDSSADRSQHTACEFLRIVLLSADEVPDDFCVPLPQAVATDASNTELQNGVQIRDRYIEWLCHQVRKITTSVESWLLKVADETSDADIKAQATEASRLIQDQLRVAEIELSIQRARLSREQSQIMQQAEKLEREREQFSRHVPEVVGSEADTRIMKRWKKFLG